MKNPSEMSMFFTTTLGKHRKSKLEKKPWLCNGIF